MFAVALFGATSASATSVIEPKGPKCYRDGPLWVCEY